MTVPFTKHEAALLLDIYLRGEHHGTPRYVSAKICSSVLRQIAIDQGQKIDSSYRNVTGITHQIERMESAYEGKAITKPATKLFLETVEMYRNNRKDYDKLLEEAKRMTGSLSEKEANQVADFSNSRSSDTVQLLPLKNKGKDDHMISDNLVSSIQQYYRGGMRFDDTVLRLLEERSGLKIDEELETALRNYMFCRSDGLYFLPEMVGNKEQLNLLAKQTILEKIANYDCVDIRTLYSEFCANGAETYLRHEDDLADYLLFIPHEDIRIANALKTKVIRKIGISTNETLKQAANKVVHAIKKSGCITQDDLLLLFPAFSESFLHELLDKYTDEIVPAKINDFLCYQTVESMGFDSNFSSVLNDTLEEADRLSLPPSQDILHALLSVRLGYNLRDEFNIPDDKTFRRIISVYYTANQPRAWKAGSFGEVSGGHV